MVPEWRRPPEGQLLCEEACLGFESEVEVEVETETGRAEVAALLGPMAVAETRGEEKDLVRMALQQNQPAAVLVPQKSGLENCLGLAAGIASGSEGCSFR